MYFFGISDIEIVNQSSPYFFSYLFPIGSEELIIKQFLVFWLTVTFHHQNLMSKYAILIHNSHVTVKSEEFCQCHQTRYFCVTGEGTFDMGLVIASPSPFMKVIRFSGSYEANLLK